MAKANPASAVPKETPQEVSQEQPKATEKVAKGGPKIEYFGKGAENVKFTVDPRATSIRVYANGLILTDY